MGCAASRTQAIVLSSSANQTRQAFTASANQKTQFENATTNGRDLKQQEVDVSYGNTNHISKVIINSEHKLSPNLTDNTGDDNMDARVSESNLTQKTNCRTTSRNMEDADYTNETSALSTIPPTTEENKSLQKQAEDIHEILVKGNPPVKQLTPEQVKEKYEAAITKVTNCIEGFNNSPVFTESEEALKKFRAHLLVISRSYFALKGGPNADIVKLRREIGTLMYQNKIVELLCNVVVHGYQTESYKDSEGNIINSYYLALKSSHINLLNFSDSCELVSLGMCEHEHFLKVVALKIKDWTEPHMESEIFEDENRMLKWALGIIHNIAMEGSSISLLRSLDYTNVLVPYLSSKLEMFRLSAMMALADVVEECNCEMLQSSGKGVQFLLNVLKKALNSTTRKNLGFSAKELGRAVGRVARNDANKKSLVMEGALPLLVELVKSADDIIEEREAFESMWMLAFDDENKTKLMKEPELMDLVVDRFHESNDSNVHKTCQGILWTLRTELIHSNKYRDIGAKFSRKSETYKDKTSTSETSTQPTGHVMISYQWKDQTMLKEIRDRIKKVGFRVWMDIDNMGGSTLQAMAEAIEEAKIVLVCMSEKYKNSPNCRAEAEYAFQKQKRIIPLIMEKSYRPDGWLGMILGSKLFYDFSGKYPFEVKVTGLLKELDDCFNKYAKPAEAVDSVDGVITEPIVASRTQVCHSEPVSRESSDKVKAWDKSAVIGWLEKHDLSKHSELVKLSGREISFLSKLRFEAPEYFYKTVESKLGVQSLLDLVKFIEAMDDL